MALALVEVTFESISTNKGLFAFSLRDACMPVSVVNLAIFHGHLSFAVALPVLQVALVYVAITHGQVTLSMGHPIGVELSFVNIAVCGCNLFNLCHLSVYLYVCLLSCSKLSYFYL